MDIIFADEQYAQIDGEKFALVSAFRIPSAQLVELRTSIYRELSCLLNLVNQKGTSKVIEDFPILHGSNFLRNYPDDIKLRALKIIFNSVLKTDGEFFRLGYFDGSAEFLVDPTHRRNFIISTCIFGVWCQLWKENSGEAILVSEFDKESLKQFFRSSTSDFGNYSNLGVEDVSLPMDKMIGHYFATKDEIGCQIADLAAYVALKSMSRGTDFHNDVGDIFDSIKDRFVLGSRPINLLEALMPA